MCARFWSKKEGWGGTPGSDTRSFAQVVRARYAPCVMVLRRPIKGLGRDGFGSDVGAEERAEEVTGMADLATMDSLGMVTGVAAKGGS